MAIYNDFIPGRDPYDVFANKPTQGAGGLPWPKGNSTPKGTPTTEPPTEPQTNPNDTGAAGTYLGLSMKDWIALIAAMTSAYGATQQPKPQPLTPTTTTNDPQIQALLKTQNDRLNYSNPLYQAMISMSMGLLPTNYQMPMPAGFGSPAGPLGPTGPGGPTVPPVEDDGSISRGRDLP